MTIPCCCLVAEPACHRYLCYLWPSNSQWAERTEMPFIKTSKRAYRSPASALRCATWCIACLIRLVQANPTVTNCALLFTLITPSEEVGLCWARPRSTSGSQRSQSSRVATSGVNTDLRRPPPPNAPTSPRPLVFYSVSSSAQTSCTFYREINVQ